MELRQLQNLIRTLIELERTDSPVVSYFLDLDDVDGLRTMQEQVKTVRKALDRGRRQDFDRSVARIENHVPWKLSDTTRSVAVFARAGSNPLFMVMEFEATVPTRLVVGSMAAVFPLVQLKDNYHRYVLLICNEESARVLEISLGSVTREILTRRPELRKRVGREWTKLHYQSHRRDRTDRFVKEKIAMVDRIMSAGGHSHLMLAGSPQMLQRVRKSLPKAIENKLVDTIPAAARDRSSDIVLATLSTFIEHEEQESVATVSLLREELQRGGLAVCGYGECYTALQRGQADQLIVLDDRKCLGVPQREELVRLAVQQDVPVEVVQKSEELAELGGAGCLLRYEAWASAETPLQTAAG